MAEPGMILAVVGMTREAKILAGGDVLVGGGDFVALSANLEAELKGASYAGVISFGLCGALATALKVGDLVVAEAVSNGEQVLAADSGWTQRLMELLPGAALGRFANAERPVGSAADKAALGARTGAIAVDLESFVVARLAKSAGLPFAVLRAVSDDAKRALPPAAQVGLGADGRPAIGPVLGSLRRRPWQIGALLRTALEAEDGFHALERAREALGPRLAGPG